MNKKAKAKLIKSLLESPRIRMIYDNYIIESISFEAWVENTVDDIIERRYHGSVIDITV